MATMSGNIQLLADDLRGALLQRRAEVQATAAQTREALRSYRFRQQETVRALHAKANEIRDELTGQRSARKAAHRSSAQVRTEAREARRIQISELRSEIFSRLGRYKMERRDNAKSMHARLADELGALRNEVNRLRSTAKATRRKAGEALHSRVSNELGTLKETIHEIRETARQSVHGLGEIRREFAANLSKTLTEGHKDVEAFIGDLREELHHEAEEIRHDVKEAREHWSHRKTGVAGTTTEPEAHAPAQSPAMEFDEDDLYAVIAEHSEGIGLVDIGAALGTEWRGLIGLARSLLESGRVEKRQNRYFHK